MLEEFKTTSPEQLDTQYPIKSIFENLEEIYPHLYENIGIERDDSKLPVILLTGLSGSGKDSVLEPLLESNEAFHVVTATNRPRRVEGGEREDAYVWMRQIMENETDDEYLRRLKNDYWLIESNFHYGFFYGLPYQSLFKEGLGIPILRVDINGVIALNEILPNYRFQPISVGVFPDSWTQAYESILTRDCKDEEYAEKNAKKRVNEDFNNVEKYKESVNYFIHNSRSCDIEGFTGLDISIEALRHLIKRFA